MARSFHLVHDVDSAKTLFLQPLACQIASSRKPPARRRCSGQVFVADAARCFPSSLRWLRVRFTAWRCGLVCKLMLGGRQPKPHVSAWYQHCRGPRQGQSKAPAAFIVVTPTVAGRPLLARGTAKSLPPSGTRQPSQRQLRRSSPRRLSGCAPGAPHGLVVTMSNVGLTRDRAPRRATRGLLHDSCSDCSGAQ